MARVVGIDRRFSAGRSIFIGFSFAIGGILGFVNLRYCKAKFVWMKSLVPENERSTRCTVRE